jgi:hypothetical protein
MQTRLMRIDTDVNNVQMVTKDDGGRIPAHHQEFVAVFTKEKADTLPPHRQIEHAIDLGTRQQTTIRADLQPLRVLLQEA